MLIPSTENEPDCEPVAAWVSMAASHAATMAVHAEVASGDAVTAIDPASTAYVRALFVAYPAKRMTPAFQTSVCADVTSRVHPVLAPFAAAATVIGVAAANW